MKHKPEMIVIALDGALPSHVEKMIQRGELPAFKQLMEHGCWFSDCRPPFPTITPTCWASFSTGATPATHGAVCQDIHLPGEPLDRLVTAYHSANIHAERFWESAARIGKRSLIMQLPTSGPSKTDNVFQINGAGCGAFDSMSDLLPTGFQNQEVRAQLFVSDNDKCNSCVEWKKINPASGQWQPHKGVGEVITGINSNNIAVLNVDTAGSRKGIKPFSWYMQVGQNYVRLAETQTELERGVLIKEGQWTDTLERKLTCNSGRHIFKLRAKLLHADGENRRLKVFFSEMGDAYEYITPPELAEELLKIPGIAPNYGHHDFLGSGIDHGTFLEAEAMNFEWQWGVLCHAVEKFNLDIAVIYSVFIDSINHLYRNIIEGIGNITGENSDSIFHLYDNAYKLADHFLDRVLKYCDNGKTTIAVVSDHGSVGYDMVINPHTVLEDAGLLAYNTPAGGSERKVDWSRTIAYPVGTCHVFINLKGRDPYGIVEECEYDKYVQKVIRALQLGFRDDERGIYSLAFALRREEAGLIGLGGNLCGDVIYGISGSKIGGYIGGVHACQIPTARTKTGDVRSLLVMSGPGFESGKVINRAVNLYDAAPTLCHALNYPQPAQVEGAVIFQALKRK